MRALIDGCVFENDRQIGIWRIFYEVLDRIGRDASATLWLRGRQLQISPPRVPCIRDGARLACPPRSIVRRMRRGWSKIAPLSASVRRATLFHSTYFTPCPVPGIPSVVTVYDMAAERLFYTLPYHQDIERKRVSIQAATLCICISSATAKDLVEFYPEVSDRVRVIPLGTEHISTGSSDVLATVGQLASRVGKYALFVGSRHYYKNFALVLAAMALPTWPRGISLSVVGAPSSPEEVSLIQTFGLGGRVTFLGQLPDRELREQYQRANCFIFPSSLEGFGLPLLEAQINGAPVICSDISVFREVAATGAVFFDPRLAERLTDAIVAVQNTDVRRRVIEAGYENVRRFSWNRTAAETLAVYREALRFGPRRAPLIRG
jgi:glycosyltransferase involved in cell wall biosynthesis